jgi:hypothetical protein
MDTLQPRADWETVDDKWFRKTQTYTEVFDPELDLDNYILVGAPFAGAIGMLTVQVISDVFFTLFPKDRPRDSSC